MFCYNCGAKLIPNAKFCFQCGQKIDLVTEQIENVQQETETLDGTIVNENVVGLVTPNKIRGPEIIIEIAERQLKLSDEISAVNIVRGYFSDYAEKNVAKFRDYAKANVKCFDDIYEKAIPFAVYCIEKAVENSVEIAKNLGIIDMNYEWLTLLLEGHMDCAALFSYYSKIASALEKVADELASYRGLQRANIPHWYGGGFGIMGAIKGQIQATALNIGTNIIREIGNAITDSRDREKFNRVKENLYKNSRMMEDLVMILYSCSFMPYYALLPIFEEVNIISAETEREDKTIEKAREAFYAYFDRTLNQESCLKVILDTIQLHPFEPQLYIYIEWISKDVSANLESTLHLLNLEYLYRYEKISFERMMFEEINNITDESIKNIQCKLRMLMVIEQFGSLSNDEVAKSRSVLRNTWGHAVQLLPEYDTEEIRCKIEAYTELEKEYGDRRDWFKVYEQDIGRLKRKYENKVRLPLLEMDPLVAKKVRDRIADLVKNKKFDELWNEADKENGYAQTLLFRFYISRIGNLEGKIDSIEKISGKCLFLSRKMQSGSPFARFIYDVMVYRINLRHNPASDEENANRIHTEYLYAVSEAAKADIVYAKFCLITEIMYKESWENYEHYKRYDSRLPKYSSDYIRFFIKDAANSLIPGAVDRLSDLYQDKGHTYLCDMEKNFEGAKKLQEIYKMLDILDVLGALESIYELQVAEVDESKEEDKVLCKQCGNLIRKGKKFCSQCGTKII